MTKDDLLLARRVLTGEYDPILEPEGTRLALATLQALIDGALAALDAPPGPDVDASRWAQQRAAADPPAPPPARVETPLAAPPAPAPAPAPASATVSGSGGPQNAYEAPMTTHPRAVGSCPDCSGQLRHSPTCPRLGPPATAKASP